MYHGDIVHTAYHQVARPADHLGKKLQQQVLYTKPFNRGMY